MTRSSGATLYLLSVLLLVSLAAFEVAAQGPRGFGGGITLGPDDVAAFPDPPAGFDALREDIPHGKLEMITYESKSVGTTRKMTVYTPPGYTKDKKYPVLYHFAQRLFREKDSLTAAEQTVENSASPANRWTADNGNGTYSNPLFYEEFEDPDVIRVGD
ncbi:MAG: hypothetical protein ACQESR_26560, partial [Planctomycetota bacterium]